MADFIILQLLAGISYLPGLVLVVVGVIAKLCLRGKIAGKAAGYALFGGALLVLLSGAPCPGWLYAIWLALLLVFSFLKPRLARRISAAALILLSIAMAAYEICFMAVPSVPLSPEQTVYVVGD